MQEDNLWQACLRTVMQQTFYQSYWNTFSLLRAETDEQRERVFRLRHEVYRAGRKEETPDGFLSLMEKDAYDDRAAHYLLLHTASGDAAGTVRILMPSVSRPLESFEIQGLCPHPLFGNEERVQRICEVSRLCMSPKFRRRPGDGRVLPAYNEQEAEGGLQPVGKAVFRRRITYAPLGLLMAAFEGAMDKGILDCVSLVDPDDLRTMKRLGIPHKILGPKVESNGPHVPVIFNVQNALDGMEGVNPECWEIVSDKGRLTRRAHEIQLENWHHSIFDDTAKASLLNRIL
jgi:N-acyl amino acid synthase of PEP-CTERM/exosortase system